MNRRAILSIVGFLLFIIGGVSIVLGLIGARLSYLSIIDKIPEPWSFLVKLIMIILGIAIVYVARMEDDD